MIKKEEVEHIAKLARLGLTEKEKEKIQKDLSSILDYFKLLRKLDTSKVEPTSHSFSSFLVKGDFGRKDEINPQPLEKVRKLIEAAPDTKDGFVRVKAVF
jgi:aspartyl-tRNA(Asn)/glutamyl-tRNA(Gln) amidotransferase subunit C